MSYVKTDIVDTKVHVENTDTKVSVPKVVTASLSGLAGGAAVGSVLLPGIGTIAGLVIGSLFGAGITGLAEYQREKKVLSHNDQTI